MFSFFILIKLYDKIIYYSSNLKKPLLNIYNLNIFNNNPNI